MLKKGGKAKVKEYEITITPKDGAELVLRTDSRTQSRNVKMTCVENAIPCTVTRTAKKEVSFAGVKTDESPAPAPAEAKPEQLKK